MIKQRFGICLAIALDLISTQASAIIGLQSAHAQRPKWKFN
jgi:hypothetical protein